MRTIQKAKVAKRSGFDKSFHNLFTAKVGTLVPMLCDEVIPNSKINLRLAVSVSMPPLASDTFMKCDYKVEAFFIPMRLLYGGFQEWFADSEFPYVMQSGDGNIVGNRSAYMPVIDIPGSSEYVEDDNMYLAAGSLADYLGFSYPVGEAGLTISAMPFLAYHRVYDDYYRNTLVSKDVFARAGQTTIIASVVKPYLAAMLPFVTLGSTNYKLPYVENASSADSVPALQLADGKCLLDLRQRNFGFDYFTSAMPSPQLGSAAAVNVTSNTFTIAQLRSMNSLQQFRERNELAGTRFAEVVHARYGADLSNYVSGRSVFLGAASYPVYSKGVSVSAANASQSSSQNPFATKAGGKLANAYASGSDFIIDGFVANEPGYIMVLGSFVPKSTYGRGIRRYLLHYNGAGSISDMANNILQNVGNQPIYAAEVGSIQEAETPEDGPIFGYTDRYAEFCDKVDEIHGLIRDGQSLKSFALQRTFGYNQQLNSSFLEIPTDFLDQVTAASADVSNYGVWIDSHFDYKVAQPLAPYCVPSLQNPAYEHGNTISIHRGGFHF